MVNAALERSSNEVSVTSRPLSVNATFTFHHFHAELDQCDWKLVMNVSDVVSSSLHI